MPGRASVPPGRRADVDIYIDLTAAVSSLRDQPQTPNETKTFVLIAKEPSLIPIHAIRESRSPSPQLPSPLPQPRERAGVGGRDRAEPNAVGAFDVHETHSMLRG